MVTPEIKRALTHVPRDEDNQKVAHESANELCLDIAQSIGDLVPGPGRGPAILIRLVEDFSIRLHHEIDQLD